MASSKPSSSGAGPAAETATLAGGCFWCLEAVFTELSGVLRVDSGYAGGQLANPSYEDVCTGQTGHAEVVQVTFDPARLPYDQLLRIFFTIHDPTTLDRQGGDVGTQYRSAIFYHDSAQHQAAEAVLREISEAKIWRGKIVTEIVPFTQFFPAEEYHRNYFQRNPTAGYCRAIIAPKVAKFRHQFTSQLKAR
ncbi:MAG: peptide-methionine (S)-S-oxide reductase MsrA [Thermoplasmata archaeon]|nr:peptide-methionine (S)-S-oxide reductase MsrA [Thermoplasmata archaeon]